uniref:Lipocalin/cytosolic fatty-acid binding domain-containing protein n=1 Tax=Bos indicus x Bos taurus TaxID=30522 RepID=A0A4W2FN32_BOBOX
MKALLLSLVLGLLAASQGDVIDASQFTGRWLTHFIAAENIDKITEGAPFHIFMRYIEFDEENGTIHFHFYIKKNGECIEKYVSGLKEENFYAVDYAGHNEFQLIRGDANSLLTHTVNVDGDGKETELVQLFGTGDDVGPEYTEAFYNTVREKGIPEENILNFIDNGNGIILFPCPYHSPGL